MTTRLRRWLPFLVWPAPAKETCHPPDTLTVHNEYADFVFRALQRLGVRSCDLDDLKQEVFRIVHERLHTFDPSQSMPAWLVGICKKVAHHHRRRRHLKCEVREPPASEPVCPAPSAEHVLLHKEREAQAKADLDHCLDALDDDKRLVFVMFEIDRMSCEAIAKELDLPLGTVHSRLHAARAIVRKAYSRLLSRRAQGGRR